MADKADVSVKKATEVVPVAKSEVATVPTETESSAPAVVKRTVPAGNQLPAQYQSRSFSRPYSRPGMRNGYAPRANQEPVITEEVTGIIDIFGTDGRAMARVE